MFPLASGFALLLAALQGEAYVADGATLVISGTPLQIEGIEVAEPRSPLGAAARAEMEALVSTHLVTCRATGQRRGMRLLAVCTIAGEDLGAALVSRGVALDCATDSAGRYRALEPVGMRERLTPSAYCGD